MRSEKKHQMTKGCVNCSSADISVVFSSTDYFTKTRYYYHSCENCGLLFIDPLPSRKRLKDIYEFNSIDLEKNANSLLFIFWENKYLRPLFSFFGDRVNSERISQINSLITSKKNRHLLDLGCGTGIFLKKALQSGWKVSGQEISKASIVQAKQRISSDVEISNNFIEKLQFPSGVRAITMWHVFEHITEFKKTIKHISSSMSKGSFLIMETPNAEALSIKMFKSESPMTLVPEHITFWSEDAFRKLLKEHSFELVSVSYPMTFPFTTTSAAYKHFMRQFNNILALSLLPIYFLYSIFMYTSTPKNNESIRVIAKKI